MPLLNARVGKKLKDKNLTIAFAESATAGRLCADLSLVENAGNFLKGGIICYDACIKESLLNVNHEIIKRYTPESMEVTKAIAIGLSKLIPADIHIGVTGLTCPGGSETKDKPVGTMFIYACKNGKHVFSERILFEGDELKIVSLSIKHCLKLLDSYLDTLKINVSQRL